MRYGVMNIPTVILFKNGREIDRKVGVMPGAVFTQALERICKSQSGPRTTGAGPAFIHASGEARSRSSSSRVSLGRRARRRTTCRPHRRGPGHGRRFRDTGSEKSGRPPRPGVRDRARATLQVVPLLQRSLD